VILHPVLGERLALRPDRGGCNRLLTVVQIRMGDAAGVPELQQHPSAPLMDGLSDRLPCLYLRVGPDPRRERVADGLRRDVGRLADDEGGIGALGVVVGGVGRNAPVVVGPAAGHRRHDDAVGEIEVADGDGREEGRRHGPSLPVVARPDTAHLSHAGANEITDAHWREHSAPAARLRRATPHRIQKRLDDRIQTHHRLKLRNQA